ncbi:CehA/McbA family metallohydrolase [Sphingomonas sp. SRS2]|uniref:CehA/McbA family metallohydrolase n=1 Tax=Sphingomonas sp. SRS2 TaxID=133190 RepID=UPI000AED5090|nr:CehA/McbA family metallohydrolase [Sphingomonas sp. SRS2]
MSSDKLHITSRSGYYIASVILGIALMVNSLSVSAHNDHPLGREQIDWDGAPQVLRTIALGIDFRGGGFTVAYRPNGKVETRDGRECLVGPHFLFDIDDKIAFDLDSDVEIELIMDRSASSGFNLSYDRSVHPLMINHKFDQKDRWAPVKLVLERARLANRKLDHTDLSISAPNALFPTDSYQEDQEVVICGMKLTFISSANQSPEPNRGKLNLHVTAEDGTLITTRMGLYKPDGLAPIPSDQAINVDRYGETINQVELRTVPSRWPSEGRFAHYINGNYGAELEAGRYQLVLTKGPEFRMHTETLDIESGKTLNKMVVLKRWRDLPAEGWYSADNHIHIERPDPSYNRGILAYTQAEDVHLSNLLQAGNVSNSHFSQYAFGLRGQYLVNDYSLVSGQESPRTSHLGHSIGLNGQAFHGPGDKPYLYVRTADAIHAEGGMWGYAHVFGNVSHVNRGLALDVPLGIVDFVEVLQLNILGTEYLYDFLNMGFKLLPSAGSDYPYFDVAGSERIYARLEGEFTVKAWFDAWQQARSFVSNGPVIEFSVNGNERTNEFSMSKGERLSIHAIADINPDFDELERLELVVHGEVVKSAKPSKKGVPIVLDYEVQAEKPLWFALRTYGKGSAKAHTAPFYVSVDGDNDFRNRKKTRALAQKYSKVLVAMKESTPSLDEEPEHFDTHNDILPMWQASKPELDMRIDKALKIYRELMQKDN